MEMMWISPANVKLLFIPGWLFSLLIPVIGVAVLTYILAKRIAPLFRAAPETSRTDNIISRLYALYDKPHHRMPRYVLSGAIHITILISLIILSLRIITLVASGISPDFVIPGLGGVLGVIYGVLKDLAETVILVMCIVAMVRRGIYKPARYAVPEKYGKDKSMSEAVLLVGGLGLLMLLDMFFAGSEAAAKINAGETVSYILPMTGMWIITLIFQSFSTGALQVIHILTYFTMIIFMFAYLCVLPFGRFFHFFTAPPNVFFLKLKKGSVKPVKYGVDESKLEEIESFGVKKFDDFTWKNVLDFYACTDCGRCSDNCPANAVGRPLSPRFITIKGRDRLNTYYPVFGEFVKQEKPLIGDIYEEDEIWSCTTCGACEEECPVMVEYIDKIVDLRRGMVDDGMVPQSLQKPLSALEKRGNPWGKMEKKRADWAANAEFAASCPVKILEKSATAETLFFLDSITSYDDRCQEIGRSCARILQAADIDFGVLGKAEKDSGHEVRRFGEEMLFQQLRDDNSQAINDSGVSRIVTADPHAYNALKNDYQDIPPVFHISQIIADQIKAGRIQLKPVADPNKVYAYHDPCYLGRHSEIYDAPRQAIDAIPGIKRVEIGTKFKDRSFCCGGGGLMLFYEPHEEMRMGQVRVEMAQEAGVDVIVTACPFCMVNIEDAIKTSGLEGKMEAIDLVELIDRHLQ